jgi:hypothetical protein
MSSYVLIERPFLKTKRKERKKKMFAVGVHVRCEEKKLLVYEK